MSLEPLNHFNAFSVIWIITYYNYTWKSNVEENGTNATTCPLSTTKIRFWKYSIQGKWIKLTNCLSSFASQIEQVSESLHRAVKQTKMTISDSSHPLTASSTSFCQVGVTGHWSLRLMALWTACSFGHQDSNSLF